MTPTATRPGLGTYVFGASAIALGAFGLGWGDFATNWQRVGKEVPLRETLAYLTAAIEVAGGCALLSRRTAKAGAAVLTALFAVFVLLWVPVIVAKPRDYDGWGNFFEELALVIAGVIICSSLAPSDSAWARRRTMITRSFGVCVVSFGTEHLLNLPGVAGFTPSWIPPGQMFWAIATTVFFFLAAVSLFTGILDGVASRLLAAMICGFEVLVWVPRLFAGPGDHFNWAGNGICLVLAGAAWVVADSINASRRAAADLRLPPA